MAPEIEKFWSALLDFASQQYEKSTYDVWIKPAYIEKVEDNQIFIHVPSEIASNKWTKDLQGKIIELSYLHTGQDLVPVFVYPSEYDYQIKKNDSSRKNLENVMQEKEERLNEQKQKKEVPPEILERANLKPEFTFENFIIADSNQFAYTAATVAASQPKMYNPLLLYGGTGLGKTHLMQAVGHDLLSFRPNAIVKYVNCHTFIDDYINAIRNSKGSESNYPMQEFQNKYRNVDLLLIDDIQFLEGKTETQTEFFNTFEAIYNNNGQIILTSDRPIDEIEQVNERLLSRFNLGVTCDIEPPNYETRVAILKDKAENYGMELPEEGYAYIAKHFHSNVRELEGALRNIKVKSVELNTNNITLDVVISALSVDNQTNKVEEITIEKIQKIVSNTYNVSINDLIGKKRTKDLVLPRQIAMFLARTLTDSSLPKIGKEFGNRDHTTVLYACDKIEERTKTDNDFANEITALTTKIKN